MIKSADRAYTDPYNLYCKEHENIKTFCDYSTIMNKKNRSQQEFQCCVPMPIAAGQISVVFFMNMIIHKKIAE
jgi:hypothetical protein